MPAEQHAPSSRILLVYHILVWIGLAAMLMLGMRGLPHSFTEWTELTASSLIGGALWGWIFWRFWQFKESSH